MDGPLFLKVTVPVTVLPALAVAGTVTVVVTSARATMVVESVAVSLEVFSSPPPFTDTLFTSGVAAFCATLTVKVMALPAAPVPITVLEVQVTTCPTALQLQPVPVTDT